MNMRLRWVFLAGLIFLMSNMACGFVGGAFSATPLPSGLPLTPSPIAAESAPATTSTVAPTAQPTVQPAGPIEFIALTAPLPGQGVRHSIRIEGYSEPTSGQQLGILVRNANGQVIGSANAKIQAPAGQRGAFSAEVPLDPNCPTQVGRVVVYAVSARDGGPTHLSSVEVQLNSEAPANVAGLNPNRTEAIVITAPALNVVLSNTVKVSGFSEFIPGQMLVVEVRGSDNQPVGRVMATVAAGPDQRGAFSVEVPLQWTGNQPGRVVVYVISPQNGKTVHLNSVDVQLDP